MDYFKKLLQKIFKSNATKIGTSPLSLPLAIFAGIFLIIIALGFNIFGLIFVIIAVLAYGAYNYKKNH